jgi:phosphatidylserine/phosphatidylglycerophosphate/cardiolipin synthase-like enzyme
VALRDEYPPILNDLEAINKVVQSETLRNLEGDRALVPALQRVDGVLAHREVLLNALDDAQESILILSGFVSGFAVNDDFIKKIESAISRGVKVQIGFGWKHPSGSQPTNLTVKKELRGLLEVQEQTSKSSNLGKLEIYYFPNHSKILIQDDQISIEGSFNWLSTGDSSQNLETSIKLTDKQQVQKALDFYQNKLKSENILTIENLERFSGNYQSV